MTVRTVEKLRSILPERSEKPAGISLLAAVCTFAAAFIITNVRIGGTLSPFAPSLAAALPPLYSVIAFAGSLLSAAAGMELWGSFSELAATLVMAVYSLIFSGRFSPKITSLVSGAAYFICSAAAVAASGDWVLFLAIFFRSAMCGAMTMCMMICVKMIRKGYYSEKDAALRIVSAGAVYMLITAALCSREIFILNTGRIAAGFVTAALARKFGTSGGAAAGILSAAAFLMCEPSLGRSGAILAFSGLAAGIFQPRGKYAVNIAFICSAFAVTAAAGMPSGTPEFIADMGAAAVIYCLIPERLYIPFLSGMCVKKECDGNIRADRLSFTANIIGEVGKDAAEASDMLIRTAVRLKRDPVHLVRDRVCGRFCTQRSCGAAGCVGSQGLPDSVFRAAQSICEKKGSITVKELPSGFEGCPKKAHIADSFSYAAAVERLSSRKDTETRRLLENSQGQIAACCTVLHHAAQELENGMTEDAALSASAGRIIKEYTNGVRSASVAFDEQMRPFAEVFADEDSLSRYELSEITEKLTALLGYPLEIPEGFSCAEGASVTRYRWAAAGKYYPDCHVCSVAAEGGICGDSCVHFKDGRGKFFIVLADGMGRGGRAAAQSSMAAKLLRRLILSGLDTKSAVRMLDSLISDNPDEVFTTLDIAEINLFTGQCLLYKLGGAPTALMKRDEDEVPSTEYYASCTSPLGIISSPEMSVTELMLDETSRMVMMTDGVGESSYPFIDALLENEKLTCEQISERITAESEDKDEKADDMTVIAVRLYREERPC